MAQYTQGPWVQFIDRSAGAIDIVPAMRPGVIATMRLSDNGDANSHLIAAAPDLLEALSAMVDRWEPDCVGTDRRMWEAARAAIFKATGG